MKILILGGSFDPPHQGHAALLNAAAEAVRPDRLVIIPAYQAPLKGTPGAPARDRLRMLRLALLPSLPPRWLKRSRLDLRELNSRRQVFAVETLERLKKTHPGAELHFVVGSDSAQAFSRWKSPEKLRTLAEWWTARRPGHSSQIPAFFKTVPGSMPDISSTELRHALALGEDVSAWVSKPALAHIAKRKLYGARLLEPLKKSLSPERFAHTVAVARLAESLARRWNQDAGKARLAGLLHDCGRSVPVPKMAAYARKRALSVPHKEDIIRRHPLLLHAYIGEDLARRRFGVTDPHILSAIGKHTLGAKTMSPLDRLLYVADATSQDRAYPGVKALRVLAFRDLDKAFRACVKNKLDHARASGGWLHPTTLTLWNSLQR